jgi:rubredoxin
MNNMKFFYGKSLCRTRTPLRIPTPEEFIGYRGGHTHQKWTRLPHGWHCPSCGRSKYEQVRWTKCITGYGVPKGEYQWLAPIHEHHDHGGDAEERAPRIRPTMLCFDCNNAEGRTKTLLDLPCDFSFSPDELREFITGLPHCGVDIDLDIAKTKADQLLRFR